MGTSPAIVYITEVSRPDLRGSLISAAPTLASLGMVLVYMKGAYMSWRIVAWSGVAYTLVPVLLIQLLVPESPVWLVAKGRIEDAAQSLKYLYKSYPEPEHGGLPLHEMHLKILIREHEARVHEKMRSASKQSFSEIIEKKGCMDSKTMVEFRKPSGYKPMAILFGLFLIQQFSGIYITLFYAVTFFEVMVLVLISRACSNLYKFAGDRNRNKCIYCIDFRGRNSPSDVYSERVVAETI